MSPCLCPWAHPSELFGFRTGRHRSPCLRGRCVGVGCLAWSWEGPWVFCHSNRCSGLEDVNVSHMMSVSQRKQPFAGVRNNPVLHTQSCMHEQLLISGWHLLYEFVHHLSCLSCKINAFDRTGIFSGLIFMQASFHFSTKLSDPASPMSPISGCGHTDCVSGILDSEPRPLHWEQVHPRESLPHNVFEREVWFFKRLTQSSRIKHGLVSIVSLKPL